MTDRKSCIPAEIQKNYSEVNIIEDQRRAKAIHFSKNYFMLETFTGKQLEFPYSVSPRLLLATPRERAAGALMPGGYGVEWEVLNEHLSVDGLIQGKVSTESWRSVYEWYELRQFGGDVSSTVEVIGNQT